MRLLSLAAHLSVIASSVMGCGGTTTSAGDIDEGDPYAPPSMLTLPTPDVRESELSEKMRFGWTLAEESFDTERPPAPPSGEVADYQSWAEGDLARWLERKSHTVESARRELDEAAEETHRQRIMAGAVVGLMYEAVARDLRSLPIPAEIQREPEIADIFRSILVSQASPYLEHARRAYRACAANAAGGPEGMRHWSGYCATRADSLPEADEAL
jgi:hypothetical protein